MKNQNENQKIKIKKNRKNILNSNKRDRARRDAKAQQKLASTSHKKDFPQFPGLILIFTDSFISFDFS